MIRDQRVLITGGGGFIGSHLARRLAPENEVTVLDNFSQGAESALDFLPPHRVLTADVRDSDAVRRAVSDQDIVVHMAAMMGVRRTLNRPLEVLEINIDGTRTVLEEAAIADVDRVLFASTSEVYGDAPSVPYHESDITAPETNYAIAKQASERFVTAYATTHDLEYTILRYFNVYGPGQDDSSYGYVVPIFVRRALSGDPIEIHGRGDQTRDFTYISDAIDCTTAALEPAGANATFNVGTGAETKIRTLGITVADAVEAATVTHIEHPRPYVIERRCADISAAVDTLGYKPTTSLSAGIDLIISATNEQKISRDSGV